MRWVACPTFAYDGCLLSIDTVAQPGDTQAKVRECCVAGVRSHDEGHDIFERRSQTYGGRRRGNRIQLTVTL